MKKQLDKTAHIILYGVFILGTVAILSVRFSSKLQFLVILYMVAFYLIWGFIYHRLRHDDSKKLMIEYLIIGSITLVASYFVFIF